MSARNETAWKKTIFRIVMMAALSMSSLAHAGQVTGNVNVVSVSVFWGGLFVQLDNPVSQPYEAACPSNNWAFLPLTEPTYNSIYASLLSAKASNQVVVVYTNGCITVQGAVQPRIWAVDVGIRASGT